MHYKSENFTICRELLLSSVLNDMKLFLLRSTHLLHGGVRLNVHCTVIHQR